MAFVGIGGSTYSQFLVARSNFCVLSTHSLPKPDVSNSAFKLGHLTLTFAFRVVVFEAPSLQTENHFGIKLLPNFFLTISFLLTIL